MSKPNLLAKDFDFATVLPEWQVCRNAQELERVFVFKDFKSAFEFMTLCADFAEELDHHPDWSNAWNKVSVRLSTHSLGALTELDITMAIAMDQFALKILA
ncbi:4a-hydroxytetrahydrobiopterin dehydratase [Polynucleobacter sp. JS-Mosq-20-D10]|uniref:4a-hydroxytetrahydrobiopterin dehydratase n=1 Tax=Polynucleobacter sp. JS-Mosq-20-D10 TaxID=2576922 RepID=UPI001BFDEC8F|nr:4a-hydroxytetrahydrobiopterin dehydratase [Polynucleobacter sp. JS-Mosq-20-D10]QWE00835.1 4a-hydroxytetrahydrobiopterin dehydratase [Polynucleobacter sp. JS-Mosq-20-D10]